MPDTTSPSNGAAAPTPEKPGIAGKAVAAVLCLALAAGGYVIGTRMAGGAAPVEEVAASEPVDDEPGVGEVVDLDPVNVNLADGHYLRIAVSLGLDEELEFEHGAEDFVTAPAADLVLSTFAGRSLQDLSSQEGRDAARTDLVAGIHEYYGDEVVTVFFTEFVMQ